ncbi:hypothetical protein FA95DRAFT_1611696 [Auriscalpium vulgare]|uniref:Uncharacterized protein n=1 Tax=Auriscalpium vulgare TaxID=40419 RepID=A0ACB8RAC1_9AGAM|nr:hypothetical protein FA95DRAFT_1611696 [Auriscalpium vulgare]
MTLGHKLSACGQNGYSLDDLSTPHFTNGGSTGSVGHQLTKRQHGIGFEHIWESDMESLLKEMYNGIQNQQVVASRERLPRVDIALEPRACTAESHAQANPYSSNSSVDGRASPAPSFATSAHEGIHGSTLSFLTPALGFASNLSHTIIREAQEDDDRSHESDDTASTSISITDEELALLGPPCAKEGMLCRKQYHESAGKRAKSKVWLDVFVVIQKGELNMFTFGDNGRGGQWVVGGGNCFDNAHHVGAVQLAH